MGLGKQFSLRQGKTSDTVYSNFLTFCSISWSNPRCFTGPLQIPALIVPYHSGARRIHRLKTKIQWTRRKRQVICCQWPKTHGHSLSWKHLTNPTHIFPHPQSYSRQDRRAAGSEPRGCYISTEEGSLAYMEMWD